jgi:hypothetical protein
MESKCSFCSSPAYVTKMEPTTWKAYRYCVDCIKKEKAELDAGGDFITDSL